LVDDVVPDASALIKLLKLEGIVWKLFDDVLCFFISLF